MTSLLTKFHSGTSKIIDTLRLMSLFLKIITRAPIEIRVKVKILLFCQILRRKRS